MQHEFAWRVVKKKSDKIPSATDSSDFNSIIEAQPSCSMQEILSKSEQEYYKDDTDVAQSNSLINFTETVKTAPSVVTKTVAFEEENIKFCGSNYTGENDDNKADVLSKCSCEQCVYGTNVQIVQCTDVNCKVCQTVEEMKPQYTISNLSRQPRLNSILKCSYWIENGEFDRGYCMDQIDCELCQQLKNEQHERIEREKPKKSTFKKTRFKIETVKTKEPKGILKTVSNCFRCILNQRAGGSSSGGSGSGGGDDGDVDGEGRKGVESGDNYMEHGDEVSGDDDSDGGDDGSESGDEGSLNSAELYDDVQNQLDVKDGLGDIDNSDGGGSAGSEVSDSLTELGTEEAEEAASNSSDDDSEEEGDENSWQSIIIYERE